MQRLTEDDIQRRESKARLEVAFEIRDVALKLARFLDQPTAKNERLALEALEKTPEVIKKFRPLLERQRKNRSARHQRFLGRLSDPRNYAPEPFVCRAG